MVAELYGLGREVSQAAGRMLAGSGAGRAGCRACPARGHGYRGQPRPGDRLLRAHAAALHSGLAAGSRADGSRDVLEAHVAAPGGEVAVELRVAHPDLTAPGPQLGAAAHPSEREAAPSGMALETASDIDDLDAAAGRSNVHIESGRDTDVDLHRAGVGVARVGAVARAQQHALRAPRRVDQRVGTGLLAPVRIHQDLIPVPRHDTKRATRVEVEVERLAGRDGEELRVLGIRIAEGIMREEKGRGSKNERREGDWVTHPDLLDPGGRRDEEPW